MLISPILAREIDGGLPAGRQEWAGENQSKGLNFGESNGSKHAPKFAARGIGIDARFDFAKFSFRPFLF